MKGPKHGLWGVEGNLCWASYLKRSLASGIWGVVRDLMDQKWAGPGGLGLGSEVLFSGLRGARPGPRPSQD